MAAQKAEARPRKWVAPVALVLLKEESSYGYELKERNVFGRGAVVGRVLAAGRTDRAARPRARFAGPEPDPSGPAGQSRLRRGPSRFRIDLMNNKGRGIYA